MLVIFKSRAHYADVITFGDVAMTLIRLMGHKEAVPGVIEARDIPTALQNLRDGVAAENLPQEGTAVGAVDEDEEPPVSLKNRALPLIELLEAARSEDVPVMWELDDRSY